MMQCNMIINGYAIKPVPNSLVIKETELSFDIFDAPDSLADLMHAVYSGDPSSLVILLTYLGIDEPRIYMAPERDFKFELLESELMWKFTIQVTKHEDKK